MEAKTSDESEKRDDEFTTFFDIVTPAAERKRELGQQVRVAPERRQSAGRWAAAARIQLRRTALPPLAATELEPGAMVELLIKAAHPFTVPPELPVEVAETIAMAANEPEEFKQQRARALTYWEGRANALRETSLLEIANIDDDELRRLHPWGASHTWRELHEAGGSPDVSFIEGLKHGFTIAGEVQKSHVCPPMDSQEPTYTLERFNARAWAIQEKVEAKIQRTDRQHAQTLWDPVGPTLTRRKSPRGSDPRHGFPCRNSPGSRGTRCAELTTRRQQGQRPT